MDQGRSRRCEPGQQELDDAQNLYHTVPTRFRFGWQPTSPSILVGMQMIRLPIRLIATRNDKVRSPR